MSKSEIRQCGIYVRVSTNQQARDGESLDEQQKRLENYCEMRGFNIHKIYREEGKSGKDLARPKFEELINDIEAGFIDTVIIKKIDRLSRSIIDFEKTYMFLESRNVRLISLQENFDNSTAIGRAISRVVLVFAQLEREQTSERTIDVLQYRASKGLWKGGTVPYGYDKKDKKLIVDEKESKVVKKIFEIYVETGSIAEVYKELKSQNVKNRKGNFFTRQAIAQLVRNVIYAGKIKHNSEIYQGIHEPIISETISDLTQGIHKKRVRKHKLYHNHRLGGLVECQCCSYGMTPHFINKYSKGKMKRYFYYRCITTFKKDWASCSIKQVNANKLEKFVIENLERALSDELYLENFVLRLNHDAKIKKNGGTPRLSTETRTFRS